MRAIGRLLGGLAPDLVGLQEAFSAGHRKQLVRELERVSGLDYYEAYFPSGVMGSGLFILSRHPIVRAVFWRYTKNGSPVAVKHGDWYAGKGVGMVRVRLESGLLDFFDTHAIANYGTHSYTDDRLQQMRELAAFITAQAQSRAPALVVGDLNCAPGSPEFRIATETPALTDLLAADPTPYRIDHILMRPHPAYDVTVHGTQVLESGLDDEVGCRRRRCHGWGPERWGGCRRSRRVLRHNHPRREAEESFSHNREGEGFRSQCLHCR